METRVCPDCHPAPTSSRRPTRQGERSPVAAALGLYFALLATFVLLVVRDGVTTQLLVDAIDAVIVFSFVLAWRDRLRSVLRLPENPAWWVYAPLLAAGTFLVTTIYLVGVRAFLPEVESLAYSASFRREGFGWPWIVLSICVAPALVEEFAFRGVMLQALRRVMTKREVVVVTALMFTVLHIAPLAFPTLIMIGLVLGWVRLQSGSIWPCVLLHLCHNAVVLLEEALSLG